MALAAKACHGLGCRWIGRAGHEAQIVSLCLGRTHFLL
jgi:hypothetical protein